MTLVMGVACRDGFVIAADSEETVGDIKRDAQKLIGTEAPFQLVIAVFGDSSGGFSCAERIKKRLDAKPLSLPKAEEAISKLLQHHYRTGLESDPAFGLIVGFRDVEGNSALWRVMGTKLVPIRDFWCDGSGQVLATGICRSLLPNQFSVAITHHLVTQVMREGRKAAYVGGDIHTWSIRNSDASAPYFDVTNGNPRYLWGIQDAVFSAISDSLNKNVKRRELALDFVLKQIRDLSAFSAAPLASQGISWHTVDTTPGSPLVR